MSLSSLVAVTKNRWRYAIPVLAISLVIINVDYSTFLSGAWHSSTQDATSYYRLSIGFRDQESSTFVFNGIPSVHAYRWALPALIGLLPLDIDWSFMALSILISCLISILLFHLLDAERLPMPVLLPVFLMATLHQYYLEFLIYDPYQVSDAAFALSVLFITLGVMRGKFQIVVAGCILGALGRQTALVYLPFLAFCAATKRISWRQALAGGATTAIAFLFAFVVSGGNLAPLLDHVNPGSVSGTNWRDWLGFSRFLLLCFGPLLYVLAVIALLWPRESLKTLSSHGHLLVLAALVAFQPIVAGPSISGENVMRLTAFALPPIALFSGVLMARVISPRWYELVPMAGGLTIELLLGYQQPAMTIHLPYAFLLMNVLIMAGVLTGSRLTGSWTSSLARKRTTAE